MKKILAMFMATGVLSLPVNFSMALASEEATGIRTENVERETDFQPLLNQCYSRYWRYGDDCWTRNDHCPQGYFGYRRGCHSVNESDDFETEHRRRRSRSCGMTCEYLYKY